MKSARRTILDGNCVQSMKGGYRRRMKGHGREEQSKRQEDQAMFVSIQKEGESVFISDNVVVKVLRIYGEWVAIGIDAPTGV